MSAVRSKLLAILVALGATGLAGCAAPAASADSENIIGGTADSGDDAVVAIVLSSATGRKFCSSTLVAPHVLVTAAHCLLPDIGTKDRINWIVKGDDANTLWPWKWSSTATKNLHAHPHYDGDALDGNDIAVVVLDDALDAKPIPLNHVTLTQADIGTKVRYVGFGETKANDLDTLYHKHQVTMDLLKVFPDRFSGNSAPGAPEAHLCFGDSGGPGFITRDGVEYLAGVSSYVQGDCVGWSMSARVDVFTSFVEPFILEADPDYAAKVGITAPAREPAPMP